MIFLGKKVPAYVDFIAQDENGEWWGFESGPCRDDESGTWGDGRSVFLGKCEPNPNWKDSLEKVQR